MHINQKIWELYLLSNPQQQAVASLVCELERTELICEANERLWRTFIEDFTLEVLLYGYCVHQVRNGRPMVLPGRYVELRREKTRLVPKLLPHAPADRLFRRGWRLLTMVEPYFDQTGRYAHPLSSAFRCMPQTMLRITLELNLERRDNANSRPTIFTRVQNNIQAAPGGTRPWFTHSNLAGDVAHRVDLPTLIEHRAESIRALDDVTRMARDGAADARPGSKPLPKENAHRELPVSDGRDMTESRALLQDTSVIHHTIDRLAHEIQFAFGVPPQVQGRNINSERMASSNRLNEQAITHFRCSARRLRLHLGEVFALDGTVTFGEEASRHTLDQIGHLLKTNKLVKLYALANNLKEEDFDRKLVEASRAFPVKRQKTDEQKLAAALDRNPKDD